MVSTVYRVNLRAADSAEAVEIAKQRAAEYRLQAVSVSSCKQDALGKWAVVLNVIPIPPPG